MPCLRNAFETELKAQREGTALPSKCLRNELKAQREGTSKRESAVGSDFPFSVPLLKIVCPQGFSGFNLDIETI
jgi:hypothetical protein